MENLFQGIVQGHQRIQVLARGGGACVLPVGLRNQVGDALINSG
jgi:hypothetical protein